VAPYNLVEVYWPFVALCGTWLNIPDDASLHGQGRGNLKFQSYLLHLTRFQTILSENYEKLKALTFFYVVCFLLGNSPASEVYMPTFRNALLPLHMQVGILHTPTCPWILNRQSVPKRRHIKFRRRGITQKTAYNRELICS
jgi:hypothetical protein